MRVLVAQFSFGKQPVGLHQRPDDGTIGRPILALIVKHARAGKYRHIVVVNACFIDGEGHIEPVFHAQFKIVLTVARRDMNQPCAGFVGHKITSQQRHLKIIALFGQRVFAGQRARVNVLQARVCFNAGGLHNLVGKAVAQHQLVVASLVNAIRQIFGKGHGAVAGQCPRRCRPDNRIAILSQRRVGCRGNREFHKNRRRDMLFIFNFRLGQRGFFNHRPHHRLGAAIQAAIHYEFLKLGNDYRLGLKRHGGVGVVPITQNAQPLKLFALNGHPFFGKAAAFGAKFAGWHIVFVEPFIAILLFDFPFNRQAVAVPAGHISGVLAHHLLRAHNHVF